MFRRVLALGLVLAVQVGAVCAPFLHAHLDADHDDHDDHHTSVHAHFSSHAPTHVEHEGVSVEDADRDRPIYLQVFVAVEASVFQTPTLPRAIFTAVPVVERAPRTFIVVSHGHDPPLVDALDSRPPPLLLS